MTYSGQTGWLLGWHEGTQTSAQLGYSVAGAGDVDHDGHDDLLVGEPYWDGNYTDSGRAHLFSGSLGSAIFVKLGGGSVRFGASVAGVGDVNGDTYDDFLVGAPSFDGFLGGLIDCGEAQVFSGFSGLILHSFFGAASGDALGRAVGAAGDVNDDGRGDLVIGEPTADPNGSASGRARIVLMDAPFPSTYCTAKTNSQGCVPKIGFSGAPSASVGDNFVVNASQVIAQKSYFLFWGFSTTAAPFGGGTMCVHVPRLRTPLQLSGGNPNVACNGFQWFYFSHAYMAAHGLNAGDTVYAQFWSRDPGFAAPGNIGLTNALKFEIVP
jgi:hypothetical protein